MSTHLPGCQSFFSFFVSFWIAKLATSSIRVKYTCNRIQTTEIRQLISRFLLYSVRLKYVWSLLLVHMRQVKQLTINEKRVAYIMRYFGIREMDTDHIT